MKRFLLLGTVLVLGVCLSGCLFDDGQKATQSKADSTPTRQDHSTQTSESQDPSKPVVPVVSAQVKQLPGSTTLDEKEVAVLETKFGKIIIELNDELAPRHCENFRRNIRTNLYDSTTFHRVIPGFLVQGGDPNSKDDDRANDGLGGTGYTIPIEKKLPHKRGAVAMARKPDNVNKDRASNGAQFYICIVNVPYLDGKYSVFGKVVYGMDVADKIASVPRDERDNPLERVEIKASIMKYRDAVR